MDIYAFQVALFLSFSLFFVSKNYQYSVVLFLIGLIISLSSFWAVPVFTGVEAYEIFFCSVADHPVSLIIDHLSAFFIMIINFTVLTGTIYARGYLKPYLENKSRIEMAWHYFNLIWLYLSMLLVVTIRDGLAFLFVWELMSLSSFFLVIFESGKKETIKIGLNYLIQMHVGMVLIMVAFIAAWSDGGQSFGFDGLSDYFYNHNPLPLFFLFFVGFGIKAGFIPFHTWLPHAHPAAPSHVSGIMSGVMIKMGIYGILRVLTSIQSNLLYIGLFILVISLISGILGIVLSLAQRDMKKLLAYSSIENIGIIGIGIGLGVIGISSGLPMLAALGFGGGLLHILNHSLFKSMLFYTAGNVYQQTHTRDIELLGGIHKKMPRTTLFFLIGSLAVCGLPPFNGFISEFLIYMAIFKSVMPGNLFTDITLLFSLSGLVIIGGLAIFGFTKAFSIIFLGNPRSDKTFQVKEVEAKMLFPDYLIASLILIIGILPALIMKPLASVVALFTPQSGLILQMTPTFHQLSLLISIAIGITLLLWLFRRWHQKKYPVSYNSTWGCGYTGANPSLHQYTSASYTENVVTIAPLIINVDKKFDEFQETEIFPQKRMFSRHLNDMFEEYLVARPLNQMIHWLEKLAVFQTGKIQHYLLYALVFILLIFCMTLLKWI